MTLDGPLCEYFSLANVQAFYCADSTLLALKNTAAFSVYVLVPLPAVLLTHQISFKN